MIFAFVTGRKPLFIFYWTQFPSLSINVDVAVDVLAAQERAANVNPQSSFMTPFLGAKVPIFGPKKMALRVAKSKF